MNLRYPSRFSKKDKKSRIFSDPASGFDKRILAQRWGASKFKLFPPEDFAYNST